MVYAPAQSINKLRFFNSNLLGDDTISLSYGDFLREAIKTPQKFNRASLLRLEGVKVVEVVGCYVSSNHYASKGAFIDMSQGTNLSLNSTTIETMSAASGGVLDISVESKAIINDCEFISNSAIYQGVLSINVQSDVQIYNSKLQSNQALINGVMKVSGDSNILIEDCNFWDNQAEYKNSIGSLFQIKSYATILYSTFYQNRAYINDVLNSNQLGKLIEFIAIPAPIIIRDCQFYDNTAFIGTPNLYFFDTGDVTIEGTEFSNKYKTTSATNTQVIGNFIQIISSATIKISQCIFLNGNAASGGAIYIQGEARISIQKSQFQDNFATKYGGAIFCDSIQLLSITNACRFLGNQVKLYGGDALYIQHSLSGSVTINNSYFETRVATSNFVHVEDIQTLLVSYVIAQHLLQYTTMAYKTGGFFLQNIYSLTISNSDFINLYGAYNQGGGALVIEYTDDLQTSPVIIKDCIIRESISSTKGAGLSIINTKLMNITRTNITNNNAHKQGGGIFFSCNASLSQTYPCTLYIQDSLFQSNFAEQEGGAIKWNYYEPIMSNVIFKNNSAGVYGDELACVSKKLIRVKKEMLGAKNLQMAGILSFKQSEDEYDTSMQSGGTISLYFGLVDKYGSFVRTDYKSSMAIQTVKNSSEKFAPVIESPTQKTAEGGFFIIEDLVLVSTPNSTQSMYQVHLQLPNKNQFINIFTYFSDNIFGFLTLQYSHLRLMLLIQISLIISKLIKTQISRMDHLVHLQLFLQSWTLEVARLVNNSNQTGNAKSVRLVHISLPLQKMFWTVKIAKTMSLYALAVPGCIRVQATGEAQPYLTILSNVSIHLRALEEQTLKSFLVNALRVIEEYFAQIAFQDIHYLIAPSDAKNVLPRYQTHLFLSHQPF
ncbi:hypothetical protein FGO68_gene10719 [Halteria grandinella]|uniref:Right handed beta helix domain-containing protein n=1 Tax=Halteria grandinella TaxID=5974 RepID=A0A8J8P4U6_HALGN|nr:hypothetical protein FGO68_gene10719 [Halteria grandinella]